MPKVMTKPKAKDKKSVAVAEGLSKGLAFMRDLATWTESVNDRLAKIYVRADEGTIELFVVPRSAKYDFELRRLLSEFILLQSDLGRAVRGTQIPDGNDEELSAFFDPSGAQLISMG